MKRLFVSIVAVLSCFGATAVFGSETAKVPHSIQEVTIDYVRARATENLMDIVDLTHPEDISRAEQMVVSLAEGCISPEELAELGLGDSSELHTLQPGELIRRFASIEAAKSGRRPPAPRVHVLGQIREDDLRHVVYRKKAEGDSGTIIVSEVGVVTVKKHTDRWLVVPQDDLSASLLDMRIEMERWCQER